MGILRNAFIPVLPDMDKFEPELRRKLRDIDPAPEGDKVAKKFATSLTRRIDRELKTFDLPTLDLDANPRGVIKAVEESIREVERLRDNADNIELRLKANKALGDLSRFKKSIGDIAPEAAEGFAARFGAKVGPLMANLPISGPLAAGVGIAAVAVAPTLGAALAAGVVGGAAGIGIIGGIKLAARDPRVKAEGATLGAFVLADLTTRANGFVAPVLAGIGEIRQGFTAIGPDLDRIFASSRFVAPLVDSVLSGARQVIGGVADAVDKADPVVAAFGRTFDRLGGSIGDQFSLLAGDAKAGASALDDLTLAADNFIRTSGGIIHALAEIKSASDSFDLGLDKVRAKIMDLGGPSGVLEGYRKGVLGVASEMDYVTLKQAGLNDENIKAASKLGTLNEVLEAAKRQYDGVGTSTDQTLLKQAALTTQTGELTDEQRKAAAAALDSAKASQADAAAKDRAKASADALKTAQAGVTAAQQALTGVLDNLAPRYGYNTQLVNNLKAASDRLYSGTIGQTEANEAYQASWDALSGSITANKGSLDIHTQAGRTNRDALEALLTSSNELYYSNIAAGQSTDSARKKHEARTEAVRKEAEKLGLNKTETEKLITTYGKIPPKKSTDLILDGVKAIVDRMFDIYLLQRAAAEGKTIDQIRGGLGKSAEAIKGRYDTGGWTGPGSTHQPAGIVHADEYVIKKASRKRIEQRAPGLLDEMNATGQVPGYADGGGVAPVDTSRVWPFHINMSKSKVMSRAEALSRVTPAFSSGDWPPSPSAQRGDSGVWRKVVSLIRSTGPLSGSFGNAYRPGDPLWHGSGRAVDWMGYNQDRLASFLAAKKPLELIHRTGSRDYAYTRGQNKGSFNNSLMEAHRNHVHIAMDNGGELQPGWNPPIYNGTGRPEPVTPAPIMDKVIAGLRAVELAPSTIDALGAAIARQMSGALGGVTRDASRLSRTR